ncbi:tRNA pseudouridine(38-40) synthase TruA [Thiolapillus brandeum]|nr:tRNA pseudouridine(38-40) synthase TruA [Thiolapillus brandeum]
MRIALGIEYDGSRFHGWQTQQPGVRTVQQALETALSKVADHPVEVHAAGRTDTGVHASCQVAHFDTEAVRKPHGWVMGSNIKLPDDISVLWAREVNEDFHARFSARGRTYRYYILNRLSRPALLAKRVTWVHGPLDADRMHRAGQTLLGTHDFSSYRTVHCQARSPVRTLRSLRVERHGDYIVMEVYADGFLHHMVRNIAGVLLAVGAGDRPVDWAREVLEYRDRTQGGVTASPHGLYFHKVNYDPAFGLPSDTSAFPLLML